MCEGWDVKDVALHLLGGEISNVSRRRDGVSSGPGPGEDLVTWLNARNEEWVGAARVIGDRMLVELLDFAGEAFERYLATLDLEARTGHVSWVGDEPVPMWLDVAREYTERWVHQQQIRDAIGRPGLKEADLVGPCLRTFVHALPKAFRSVEAEAGTAVVLRVDGAVWHVAASGREWVLTEGSHPAPAATVAMDVDTAWRLFTRNPAVGEVGVEGDEALAEVLRSAVAIVA